MKFIPLIVSMFAFVGCATERFYEVMEIRDAPLEMRILTLGIEKMEKSNRGLYEVRAEVLEPERYRNEEIVIVVDHVPPRSRFLQVDEDWIIDFDEMSFGAIESSGHSFWKYEDLNPRKNYSNKTRDQIAGTRGATD